MICCCCPPLNPYCTRTQNYGRTNWRNAGLCINNAVVRVVVVVVVDVDTFFFFIFLASTNSMASANFNLLNLELNCEGLQG